MEAYTEDADRHQRPTYHGYRGPRIGHGIQREDKAYILEDDIEGIGCLYDESLNEAYGIIISLMCLPHAICPCRSIRQREADMDV